MKFFFLKFEAMNESLSAFLTPTHDRLIGGQVYVVNSLSFMNEIMVCK